MPWHYVLNGVNRGPVDEAELRRLRQENVMTDETLVWTDGMAEWLPYQHSSLVSGTVGPFVAGHACAECGKFFPEEDMLHYEQKWVCAPCKPIFFQRIKEGVKPMGAFVYASVGARFVALLLDGFIVLFILAVFILIPYLIVATWVVAPGKTVAEEPWLMPLMILLEYGLPAAFEIFFIAKFGATPGKMLMKIKVVTPEGGPISYGRSTGRYFAKILSGMILYIGYLMAFWDDEKRALHDRLCQSRVISTKSV